ncbi:MAG: phage terminase small subunit P27 family [Clostridiaceae bacterium]|nr:phage terminase small subunit P27 family [Clostridiaceae bacterium]
MAGQRQPIKLLQAKGRKHLTKDEIRERMRREVTVETDHVTPPDYLSKDMRAEFEQIAARLIEIGILADIDADALARYLLSKQLYLNYTTSLARASKTGDVDAIGKLSTIQDKAFKQCRASANDLGLSITSRCRLVMPKQEEKEDDPMLRLLESRSRA